eukprot:gnl/TRDRNA2_/TRDRNA2_162539_c1_seq3.p1 gnl/TRDRNA2_/TRDRNA2_162539_c1~~gnl/TRDRNA2_/TRDRNA2_162539_c1_seq3.p1  ORF type:complete len:160 (-),score=14.65 gnl/TRDRNA2_/TRDRNA2_162539_c1_seq3:642-1121(-)
MAETETPGAFLVSVKVQRLDDFFRESPAIHVLKIDAEGFNPLVLQGAQRLLSRRRVKFIVFEFLPYWNLAGHGVTLQDATSRLYAQGYLCFFMTAKALIPISGQWWLGHYNLNVSIDVFCGRAGDSDLFDAYVAFGTNNYTLHYALQNLAASPNYRWRY